MARDGHGQGQLPHLLAAPEHELRCNVKGMAQRLNFVINMCAEHGLNNDSQREPHHLAIHVEGLVVFCLHLPILYEGFDHTCDNSCQSSQSLTMEGRLEHSPFAQPEIAVDERQ